MRGGCVGGRKDGDGIVMERRRQLGGCVAESSRVGWKEEGREER